MHPEGVPPSEPPRRYGFATLAIHGGTEPDPATGARAIPVYLSSSFVFRSPEHSARLFSLEEEGFIYSRISNPTVRAIERRLALLEGGVDAVLTASGQSALALALLTLARAGDEIVASPFLYGGTYSLLANLLPRYGIQTRFTKSLDPEEFAAQITPRTKAVLLESVGNPSLLLPDLREIAAVAHAQGVPVVVDNTFPTPYLYRPLEFGADVVVHSATKWLSGNGTILAGAVVDGGRFSWPEERFPEFHTPDASYHGLVFARAFGAAAFSARLRAVALRDFGPSISPVNAFLLGLGMETLPLRMERHVANARAVAAFLREHPDVAWVNFPEFPEHPSHAIQQRDFPRGATSVVTFGLRGGKRHAEEFLRHVRLHSHLANVGDAKSLLIHPASTTHGQLSEEELRSAGVLPEMIRLSVGLEDVDDILWDLAQALQKARGA
ncbi:O-acetylhomoserine aminocarboxypropyltransferase/cysteine synthase family protein [Brockia lithotrophica]|uniref:O-acetylhomoserine sulfhydrylase n=1 Tax=Brockia lithotrophica TaxID=933949 RepID=A0A660L3N9_9BACL|nr:O-acetylhomoserine aminocarboxypropyltransferase/cysteine synthase family protein [Brockia lithotrophica]RKQ88557.1 O-acetylhomoserine sulfhydrylase [Brockia lithotrophica]